MQLRCSGEIADLRGVHQLDEQLGGDVGKRAYRAVGSGEEGGRIRSSQPESTENSDLTRFTSRSTPTVWKYSVTVSFSPLTLGHSAAILAIREGEGSMPVSIGRL